MKNANRIFLSLLICLALSACKRKSSSLKNTSTTSSSWISSFSTTSTSVTNSATNRGSIYSGKDASDNIYLSGATSDGWLVMKSSDQGLTWSQDSLVSAGTAYGNQIVGDSLGNVFNVGQLGSNGVIRKRNSTTHTWSTVYSGQINPGYSTSFVGVGVDASDHIYVVGSAFLHLPSVDVWPDTGLDQWVVLKSTDHGSTWNLIDNYHPSDHAYAYPQGLLVADSGSIYSYGYTSELTGFIRKSEDDGATWNTVFEDIECSVQGMTEWNGGLVISERCYTDEAPVGEMQLRGTTDDFAHLKTLDVFTPPSGAVGLFTGAVSVDSRNYLYYTGHWVDSSETHLILRVSRGDGTWSTIDDFTTDMRRAGGMFFDSTTGVFNVGINTTSWVIRNATVTTADAFTPASMANGSDFLSPLPAGTKRVFTTWRRHDGNFGANATAAMAAADNFCNTDPRKPLYNPTATYKAMLVSSVRRACVSSNCNIGGVGEHLDWVFAPSTTYVTYEGDTVFTTNANGIFSSVSQSPIKISVDFTWTGLTAAPDWTTDDNVCQDWTTNNGDGNDWSTAWDLHGPAFEDIYGNFYVYCDASMPLICVEQ